MKTIIAFSGYAGSGKDTAAGYLVEHHSYTKLSFADPLKKMAKIAFGFPDEHLWGESKLRETPDPRYPFSGICVADGTQCNRYINSWQCLKCSTTYPLHITPRIALQTLGTEWGRRLYTDVWADAGVRAAQEHENPRIVFSDLRFKNELYAIKRAGGKVVRILRGAPQSQHASEVELDEIPNDAYAAIIDNRGGSVREFLKQIEDLLPRLEAQ